MTEYIFSPPPVASAGIRGMTQRFPVNRIFCVGRNYEAHALEMGTKPDKEEPFYFIKSPCTLVPSDVTIPYPPESANYHYEMELVVAISGSGFRLTLENALDIVYGYASGLDMTRRDLQLRFREKGRPWDLGKDFENAAVMSDIVPSATIGHPSSGAIELRVNGEVRQKADISELINSVPEILVHLSKFYHLAPGDLIFTGTPAGVGPVVTGDVITGYVAGVNDVILTVGEAE